MLFSRIVRVGAIVAALAVAGWLLAQSQPPSKQYVVLLKRGDSGLAPVFGVEPFEIGIWLPRGGGALGF
jgi:hypothetical protein